MVVTQTGKDCPVQVRKRGERDGDIIWTESRLNMIIFTLQWDSFFLTKKRGRMILTKSSNNSISPLVVVFLVPMQICPLVVWGTDLLNPRDVC